MKVGMRKKSCIVRGVAGRVIGHSGRIRAGGPGEDAWFMDLGLQGEAEMQQKGQLQE